MQQRLGLLTVGDLDEANKMVRDLRKQHPSIHFPKVGRMNYVVLCTLSGAAHPHGRDYGQTGMSVGTLCREGRSHGDVFNLIEFSSHKQPRVSHS